MRMLVENLLNNAVNYSYDGGDVTVSCQTDGQRHVRLEVADAGIGIPAEKVPHIFEELFPRTREAARHNKTSTGLGLAIGPAIWPGCGTSSWKWPARSGPARVSPSASRKATSSPHNVKPRPMAAGRRRAPANLRQTSPVKGPIHACNVLVIDDDDDFANAVATVIRQEGHEAAVVADPDDALVSIEKRLPDAAVLDVMFPENPVAGFELARTLAAAFRNCRS